MSWGVESNGKPDEVRIELSRQFSHPLALAQEGLDNPGEKTTVRLVHALIEQCLSTFDPEKSVQVSAAGHMGFDDWEHKNGPVQTVTISIQPKG